MLILNILMVLIEKFVGILTGKKESNMWVKFYNTPMNETAQSIYVDISEVSYVEENVKEDYFMINLKTGEAFTIDYSEKEKLEVALGVN